MGNKIIQNPLARGERRRGKGKREIFRLAHHIVLLKVAHRVNRSYIEQLGSNFSQLIRVHVVVRKKEICRVGSFECSECTFTQAIELPTDLA